MVIKFGTPSKSAAIILILSFVAVLLEGVPVFGGEVVEETRTRVVVREHPRTGRAYVAITGPGSRNFLAALPVPTRSRPDYRMLDPHLKSGKILYQGPSSDRRKVYILAGSLAALGTAGGAAIIATAPAVTGAGAAGGAGAYAAAGTAVASGTVSTALIKSKPDPEKDKVEHGFESRELKKGLR